jgi:sugar phosphate isomerase/epimerase
VDEDCIKLLADLYHMEEEGDQVDGLAQYKGKIVHAHVARPGIRTCPLPNDKYDYLPFLKELETIGCERCSIEARFNNFEAEAETALLFLSIH